ncbi:MAG: hypothetical protein ACOC32_01190 [Nanoarchaeota archaeon]
MAVKTAKKRIFGIALLVTVVLLAGIIYSNTVLNDKREEAVLGRMNDIVQEYEEMQTLFFLSDFFGEESTCIALESMLASMNKDLWDLGIKIDSYRQASEEIAESPFYFEQKKHFNQRAVLYFSMLKRLKRMCDVNQTIMTFYYENKEDCPDCDPQSFVLTDIRRDLEDLGRGQELALFSFDAELDLPSVDLLMRHYNFSQLPCMVIEEESFCGLHNKKELKKILCKNASLCY